MSGADDGLPDERSEPGARETASPGARFETVDWDDLDRSRSLVTAERVVLLVGFAVVGALSLYDARVAHVYLVADWQVETVDWAFLLSLVIVVAYGVVPLLRRRERVAGTLARLRSKPLAVAAAGYLSVVAVVGLVGPALGLGPSLELRYSFNPPVGFTSAVHRQCAGLTTGGAFDELCHGSLKYPLGTNRRGERIGALVAAGARPALYVATMGGILVVPVATAVGVVAGLRGGLVDRLLMAYVDFQLSLPAVLVYFLVFIYVGPSLLVLVLAFGLFSWGNVARLVRSETIQRREQGHVTVARSLGAPDSYIAWRHVLPNVTNTLVPAVCQLLALLVLYEAGVAFLGFYEAELHSWGTTISQSISAEVAGQHQTRTDHPATEIWWVSAFPAVALTLTMLSFKLLGDGLRDALDPRGEE